jgi:lipopolysaccharide/colanic/teichoic acid biosynthesis glycosyltransferase
MLKRTFDFIIALIGLLLLLPLMLLVAMLIKLDTTGPVFYRQRRVGLRGEPFGIFKFRTMVPGADKMGSRLTTKRDPRVTRIGQILRWFKIDELPQLINVLIGDMSLIGPRPEDPHFVSFYTAAQRAVLSVRPGIIGPSQIFGRDELECYPEGLQDTEAYYVEHILPDKLARDLQYVESRSFGGDIALLARGLWATIRGAIKAKFLWRRRWRIALFAVDGVLILTAFWLAFMVRQEFTLPEQPGFLLMPLLIMMVVRLTALMYFGAYQGVFAYFGLWDLIALSKAVTLSAVISAGLTFFIGLQSHPRSVFVIDWALALFMLGALRYTLRAWVRQRWRQRGQKRQKAIVVGAGVGGEQIARALLEDPLCPYRPVAFIDETPERWGALIHGVRVLGGAAELPLAISANEVRAVFVCMADLSDRASRDVVEMCERAGVEYRVVPTLSDILKADTFAPGRTNGRPELAEQGSVTPKEQVVTLTH